MTLPADTNLQDTAPGGLLTAADFDTYQSPETDMLLHQDFADTVAVPRRQPMDYRPASYVAAQAQAAHAASEIHDDDDRCVSPVVTGLLSVPVVISAAVMVLCIIALIAWL